jgi:CRP/FNR family transcriptional regulator
MEGNWRKAALFREFTDGELAMLRKIATHSVLNRGQVAFQEGDRGDSLTVLDFGTLQLSKSDASGDQHVITTLGTGDYLGEMSLFDHGKRSLSGTATERCDVTIIPFADLLPLLEKHPTMAAKFYKNVATGIARRLRNVSGDIAFLRAYLRRRE